MSREKTRSAVREAHSAALEVVRRTDSVALKRSIVEDRLASTLTPGEARPDPNDSPPSPPSTLSTPEEPRGAGDRQAHTESAQYEDDPFHEDPHSREDSTQDPYCQRNTSEPSGYSDRGKRACRQHPRREPEPQLRGTLGRGGLHAGIKISSLILRTTLRGFQTLYSLILTGSYALRTVLQGYRPGQDPGVAPLSSWIRERSAPKPETGRDRAPDTNHPDPNTTPHPPPGVSRGLNLQANTPRFPLATAQTGCGERRGNLAERSGDSPAEHSNRSAGNMAEPSDGFVILHV